jgi:hypothetical protein
VPQPNALPEPQRRDEVLTSNPDRPSGAAVPSSTSLRRTPRDRRVRRAVRHQGWIEGTISQAVPAYGCGAHVTSAAKPIWASSRWSLLTLWQPSCQRPLNRARVAGLIASLYLTAGMDVGECLPALGADQLTNGLPTNRFGARSIATGLLLQKADLRPELLSVRPRPPDLDPHPLLSVRQSARRRRLASDASKLADGVTKCSPMHTVTGIHPVFSVSRTSRHS